MRNTVLVLVALVFAFTNISCGSSSSGGGGGGGSTGTVLTITNIGTSQLIIGFVTAAVGGACPDADTLLTARELSTAGWCTNYQAGVDHAGKCLVTLDAAGGANASVTVPNLNGKCMSGGFGAGGFAQCETTEYPNGWTQAEFTLNPTASTQEAVDISAVNGVNYPVSILFSSSDEWYYGDQNFVTQVGPNNAINQNVGVPGVFPNGCTDCIQLVNAPPCPNLATIPTCQASRICNVYRDNAAGGTVEFQVGNLF